MEIEIGKYRFKLKPNDEDKIEYSIDFKPWNDLVPSQMYPIFYDFFMKKCNVTQDDIDLWMMKKENLNFRTCTMKILDKTLTLDKDGRFLSKNLEILTSENLYVLLKIYLNKDVLAFPLKSGKFLRIAKASGNSLIYKNRNKKWVPLFPKNYPSKEEFKSQDDYATFRHFLAQIKLNDINSENVQPLDTNLNFGIDKTNCNLAIRDSINDEFLPLMDIPKKLYEGSILNLLLDAQKKCQEEKQKQIPSAKEEESKEENQSLDKTPESETTKETKKNLNIYKINLGTYQKSEAHQLKDIPIASIYEYAINVKTCKLFYIKDNSYLPLTDDILDEESKKDEEFLLQSEHKDDKGKLAKIGGLHLRRALDRAQSYCKKRKEDRPLSYIHPPFFAKDEEIIDPLTLGIWRIWGPNVYEKFYDKKNLEPWWKLIKKSIPSFIKNKKRGHEVVKGKRIFFIVDEDNFFEKNNESGFWEYITNPSEEIISLLQETKSEVLCMQKYFQKEDKIYGLEILPDNTQQWYVNKSKALFDADVWVKINNIRTKTPIISKSKCIENLSLNAFVLKEANKWFVIFNNQRNQIFQVQPEQVLRYPNIKESSLQLKFKKVLYPEEKDEENKSHEKTDFVKEIEADFKTNMNKDDLFQILKQQIRKQWFFNKYVGYENFELEEIAQDFLKTTDKKLIANLTLDLLEHARKTTSEVHRELLNYVEEFKDAVIDELKKLKQEDITEDVLTKILLSKKSLLRGFRLSDLTPIASNLSTIISFLNLDNKESEMLARKLNSLLVQDDALLQKAFESKKILDLKKTLDQQKPVDSTLIAPKPNILIPRRKIKI